MIRVGVIGIGMMGNVHLDVYAQQPDVQVVALADHLPERRSGQARTALNIQDTAQGFTGHAQARQYAQGLELIADPALDLIDICVPTPQHIDLAIAALKAGKHVLLEKPLARQAADAQRLIDAARTAPGLIMVAMCMRFWPGWSWLKQTIDAGTYGRVLAAQFRRVSSFPGGWYADAQNSGGAALDLHVHDTDFIHWCFGLPQAVRSVGYSRDTKGIDHISTQYDTELEEIRTRMLQMGGLVEQQFRQAVRAYAEGVTSFGRRPNNRTVQDNVSGWLRAYNT
ncbi:MAG: Gfo/Idh/MocA family oxidoreductase, partial [Phycisphaerae bacterium]